MNLDMPLSTQDQQDLIALEHAMWNEQTRFDLDFQEARFAVDFLEFGRSGRAYNRSQIIRTDRSPIVAMLRNFQVRELDTSTALVTYESEARFGEEVEHALRSSIWTRTQDRWQMRFHQGTPFLPEAPGSENSAAKYRTQSTASPSARGG
jgi:hypothetical protein